MADLKAFADQLVNLTVKEVNELAKIMKDEYYMVMVEQQQTINDDNRNLPPQIIKQTDDDQKIVYLNKKQQIIENPRNYFLLKQLNLLDKYM